MKYVLLFVDTAETLGRSEDEVSKLSETVGTWWGEHAAAGKILEGKQLQPAATATTVRHDAGSVTIVDGPFLEAKESIGGYGVVEVKDLDEAIEMAKSWPWGGVVEIRPIIEM
jgi:hypothetical protein